MKTTMQTARIIASSVRAAIAAVALGLSCSAADAFVYKLLHSFRGTEGQHPSGGLIRAVDGNFYGVTDHGGIPGCGEIGSGCGTIYKLSPKGKFTVVYRFTGGAGGERPAGALVRDDSGNLFGVTGGGGTSVCTQCGTVFELSADGTYKLLHPFAGGSFDGWSPNGNLVRDGAGNLYGTTEYGGGDGCGNHWGCGIAYRVAPSGKLKVLHAFRGIQHGDGGRPLAGLLRDAVGNLYGAAYYGGNNACYQGCGLVYELPVGGGEKILHQFDKTDGFYPDTGLIQDPDGNLYGGTYAMGAMLYRMSPDGTFTTLYQFNQYDAYGTFPFGNVLRDGDGNLFINNYYGGGCGCGTVFELAADGTPISPHQFGASPQDGTYPVGNLLHVHNVLYGVTGTGGQYGKGTVWVLNL